jgi:hypothetical protein
MASWYEAVKQEILDQTAKSIPRIEYGDWWQFLREFSFVYLLFFLNV